MQEKKTLTFVVPAYNMTEYLERCVESLIASKRNDDIEVLIVDDGSSDGTLEMAKTFEARNPGIVRAIHQENKGHGGAVNTGIASARLMGLPTSCPAATTNTTPTTSVATTA